MDIKEIEKEISKLSKELEQTENREDRAKLQKNIDKLNKKLEKISEKEQKEVKTSTNEEGNFGEVVSCLFGQADKRFYNSMLYFLNKWRLDRYNSPTKYIINPIRLLTLAIAVGGIVTGGSTLAIGLIAAGYFGGIVLPKYITAVIRKFQKKTPKSLKEVSLLKGTYKENLKNAVSKFRNRKNVKKQNVATSAKTNSTKANETDSNKVTKEKNTNIENLLNNFVNAVNNVDLNDIDMLKVDNCTSSYNLLKNGGEVALNKIPTEIKEKYQKIQDYVKLVNEFSKAVNTLKVNDVNKELLDNCKSLYAILESNYGANAFKNVSADVMNKYNSLKNNQAENIKKANELELSKFVNELKAFELEKTADSVKEYERLMRRLFALSKEQRNMIYNNEMLWNKIQNLRKEVKSLQLSNNTKLESFIKHVETFKFGENVEFKSENLVAAISLYNQLTDDQRKLIPENIMRNYQDAIRYDSITALKTKLYSLDIEKRLQERDYNEILECYSIYSKWYSNDRKGLPLQVGNELAQRRIEKRKEIESFSPDLQEKMGKILKTVAQMEKFANANVNVSHQVCMINGKPTPVSYVEVISNDEMIGVCNIPWTSANENKDEIKEKIINKFPFVNEEQISFEGISKENNRGNRR